MSDPEQRRVLHWGMGEPAGYPRASLAELFAAQAARRPDATALSCGARRLTYGELDLATRSLAGHLVEAGVGPECRVGIATGRCLEMVVALLGVLRAGAAYVPLEATNPRARLQFTVADAGIRLALTAPSAAPPAFELPCPAVTVRVDGPAPRAAVRMPAVHPDNLAYVMYTSGSTGTPKGVLISQRSLVNLATQIATAYGIGDDSRVLAFSSLGFDASCIEVFGGLLSGASVHVAEDEDRQSPRRLMDLVRSRAITVAQLPPGLLPLLQPEELPSLGVVSVGGQAPAGHLVAPWTASGRRFYNVYGPTETTVVVTLMDCRGTWTQSPPIGRPLPNHQLLVLDAGGRPVGVGAGGELFVAGVGLARGYAGQPALTAECFVPNPYGAPGERMYRTGDRVRWLPEGTLEFLGRLDGQVKLRGQRVELEEVEAILSRHPAVRQAAVAVRGEGDAMHLVACVVWQERGEVPWAALREHLAGFLPAYMLPARLVALPSLPLTANGKVDRAALRDPRRPPAQPAAPARTTFEARAAALWAEVLGLEGVGVHDDFLELGGNSLLAMRIASRVRRELGADVPIRAFFEARTVAGLAAWREASPAPEAGPFAPGPGAGGQPGDPAPLSWPQESLWLQEQLSPGNGAYNETLCLRLRGRLDPAALRAACQLLLTRHGTLRTAYSLGPDGPAQRVRSGLELPFTAADLSSLGPSARERELAGLLRRHARAPFDLASPPLLRALLARLDPEEHVLLLTVHHIAADGWSISLLGTELGRAYRACRDGALVTAEEPDAAYPAFAAWQRRALPRPELDRRLAVWRRMLAASPVDLELGADRARRAVSFEGVRSAFALDEALTRGLTDLGRRLGASLFMVLAAGLAALVSRRGGGVDVPVGTPTFGRDRPELESMVGHLVDTTVLRLDLSGDPGFEELVRRAREVTLDAGRVLVPFEELVRALGPERGQRSTGFPRVVLALDDIGAETPSLPGLEVDEVEVHNGTAKFDLLLSVRPRGGRLQGHWELSSDLFDQGTGERLTQELTTLLRDAVTRPGEPLSTLALLPPGERSLVLGRRAGERLPAAWTTLDRALAARVARSPRRPALSAAGATLTYAQLEEASGRLANLLRAAGAGPGRPVAVCVDRSMDLPVAILAALKTGAHYVPLDPAAPPSRLRFIVEDAGARLLVTAAPSQASLDWFSGTVIDVRREAAAIAGMPAEAPDPGIDGEAAAYVIYTSGSTGRPKGVVVSHRSVLRLFATARRLFDFTSDDVWTLFHSCAFDFSVWEMWGALLHGARLVVVPHDVARSPEDLHRLLRDERVTVLSQTPSAFAQLTQVEGDRPAEELGSLRWVVFGGEALDPGILRGWFDRHPAGMPRLVNMYGITETTVHVTYHEVGPSEPEGRSIIGRPLPDLGVYVLDGLLQPVPVGVPGELCVGGDGLALGYLRAPALTAERFVPDPFAGIGERMYRSGDLGRWLPDGSLQYLGRNDDQVKIRGFRVELGEVEAVLGEHGGVLHSAAVVREEAGGRPRLAGYVVPHAGVTLLPDELRRHLRDRLPEHMVPATITVLDALPLTVNGKVDRAALPSPDLSDVAGEDALAPRNEAEELLASVWREVLGVGRLGVDQRFFDVGGDSMLALKVVARARELGLGLTVQDLMTHQTVAELAARSAPPPGPGAAAGPRPGEGRRDLPPGVEDAYPMTRLQVGMLYHHERDPVGGPYHNVHHFEIGARFDPGVLRRALDALVARHPVLRTTYHATGEGDPFQLVHRSVQVDLQVEDGRDLDPSGREASLERLTRRARRVALRPEQAPPYRFIVLAGRESFDLIMAELHLVLDGWSVATMATELAATYLDLLAGRRPRQRPAPPAFREYVDLEGQAIASAASRAFWTGRLAGAGPTLLPPLPPGSARPPRPVTWSERRHLDGPTVGALRDLAHELRVALKSVLLSAHVRAMGVLTGADDVVVGLPTGGRPERLGAEEMLGLFLNTLPLRVGVRGASWAGLVREVASAEAQLMPHRRFPLVEISRAIGRESLFESIFNFVDFHVYRGCPAVREVHRDARRASAPTSFPLAVHAMVSQHDDSLVLQLDYDRTRLAPEQASRIADLHLAALAAMVERPLGPVAGDGLLAPAERRRVTAGWARNVVPFPRDRSIPELFARQVASRPDERAVVDGGTALTYGELDRSANRLARLLRSRGVGPETVVGVCLERSLRMVVAWLAVLKAGGAYLPMDPEDPSERLQLVIDDAGPVLVVTERRLHPRLPARGPGTVCVDELDRDGDGTPLPGPGPGPEHLAYVMYTSGSTGRPKGVAVTHRNVVRLVSGAGYCDLGPEQVHLQITPPTFDVATFEVWGALLNGGRLVVFPDRRPDPEVLGEMLRWQRVTTLWLSAGLFHHVAAGHLHQLAGLRQLVAGGDVLSVPHVRAALEALRGCRLVNGYGPTECTTFACCHQVDFDTLGPTVPIGRPIGNTEAYVLDSGLQPAPVGTQGELYLGGDGLARGYVGRPDLTAERFVPHPFGPAGGRLYRTGDLARWLPGGILEFCGRRDDQLKIRGFRVEPGEVEAALLEHPEVLDAVALGQGDGTSRRLVAFVVRAPGDPGLPGRLRDHLAARLPRHMVPSAIGEIDSIPVTANGKPDRRALAAMPAAGRAAADPRPEDGASNVVEAALGRLWQETLPGVTVGVADDFFDVGGDSLLAMQLVSRIRMELGPSVDLETFFRHSTIRSLAGLLTQIADAGALEARSRAVAGAGVP